MNDKRVKVAIKMPVVLCLLVVLAGTVILAQTPSDPCGEGSTPAFPTPECRLAATGVEVACGTPGAIRVWPPRLQPAIPGTQLPRHRDSTSFRDQSTPGLNGIDALWQSVVCRPGWCYTAHNSGWSAWELTPVSNPVRRAYHDGWRIGGVPRGGFLQFPPPGEAQYYVDSIDAIDVTGGRVVALSGRTGVGGTLWWTDPTKLQPDRLLYQDPIVGGWAIRLEDTAGGPVAIVAPVGKLGVELYDVTAALSLMPGCLDDASRSCGVSMGAAAPTSVAGYIDTEIYNGGLYLALGDGDVRQTGLELWHIDLLSPTSESALLLDAPIDFAQAVSLFVVDNRLYLSYVSLIDRMIRIHDVTDCLEGCWVLPPVTWFAPLPSTGIVWRGRYSMSVYGPILSVGQIHQLPPGGPGGEMLLDLSGLASGVVVDLLQGGGTYTDSCATPHASIDYAGDRVTRNEHGLRNVAVRECAAQGSRIYCAREGVFDVQTILPPTAPPDPPELIFRDGFESGSTSAWSGVAR